MGEIKKIGEEYYIEFYARGLLYQQKGGKSMAQAQKLLEEIEGKIAKGEMGIIVRDVDIDVFLKTFLGYAAKEFSSKTVERYLTTIEYFDYFLQEEPVEIKKLSGVTPYLIECFYEFLDRNLSDIEKKQREKMMLFTIYLLSDILEYGISLGYINDNPTLHWQKKASPLGKIPEVLDERGIDDLLKNLDDHFKGVVRFLLVTGLRMEELAELRWDDVDRDNNNLKVKSYKGRNQERDIRQVPLDHEALGILQNRMTENQPSGDQVFPGIGEEQLCAVIDDALSKSATNKKKTFNSLRHTFAKKLLEKGVGLVRLHQLMGLDDILQIMIYEPFIPEREGMT